MKAKLQKSLALLIVFLMSHSSVWACSTCYGNPDHPMSKGLTAGVILLLSCIGFLLVAFAGFFLFLRNRMKKFSDLE